MRLQMVFEAIDRTQSVISRISQGLEAPGRAVAQSVRAANAAIGQLGQSFSGIAGAIGGGIAIHDVVRDNDAFRRLQIMSGATEEAIEHLRHGVLDSAVAWRVQTSEMTAAMNAMRANGAGLDFMRENLDTLGAAIQMLGGHGEELGTALAQLRTHFHIEVPADTMQALATMRDQLKGIPEGFDNFSRASGRLASDYAKLGHTGLQAARDLGAVYAVIAKGTGTPRQATSAVESLLGMVGDRSSARTLEGIGVRVYQNDDARREGHTLPLSEILPSLLQRYKANPFVVGSMLPEMERVLKTLLPTLDAQGNSPLLAQKLNVLGDPAKFKQDAEKIGESFQGSLNKLRAVLERFADANLAGPLQTLADVLSKFSGPIGIAVSALAGFFIIGLISNQAIAAAAGFKLLGGGLLWLARATGVASAAQWVLNAALTANPIGLAIAGVAALAAAAYLIYDNWQPISAWFAGMWDWWNEKVGTFDPITIVGKGVNALIEYLTGVNLYDVGKALIDRMREGVADAWRGVTGFLDDKIQRLREALDVGSWFKRPERTSGEVLRAAIARGPLAYSAERADAAKGEKPEVGATFTVRFENAPPGTRANIDQSTPGARVDYDMGYAFAPQ